MERITIKNSDGSYSQPTHTTFEKMFYKLAEFEDFLEENKLDNIRALKKMLEDVDYCMKINTWLMRKYGKELWQEYDIKSDSGTIFTDNIIKISKLYDDIYEEMKKEMPKKWYEYGFGNIKIEE